MFHVPFKSHLVFMTWQSIGSNTSCLLLQALFLYPSDHNSAMSVPQTQGSRKIRFMVKVCRALCPASGHRPPSMECPCAHPFLQPPGMGCSVRRRDGLQVARLTQHLHTFFLLILFFFSADPVSIHLSPVNWVSAIQHVSTFTLATLLFTSYGARTSLKEFKKIHSFKALFLSFQQEILSTYQNLVVRFIGCCTLLHYNINHDLHQTVQ